MLSAYGRLTGMRQPGFVGTLRFAHATLAKVVVAMTNKPDTRDKSVVRLAVSPYVK